MSSEILILANGDAGLASAGFLASAGLRVRLLACGWDPKEAPARGVPFMPFRLERAAEEMAAPSQSAISTSDAGVRAWYGVKEDLNRVSTPPASRLKSNIQRVYRGRDGGRALEMRSYADWVRQAVPAALQDASLRYCVRRFAAKPATLDPRTAWKIHGNRGLGVWAGPSQDLAAWRASQIEAIFGAEGDVVPDVSLEEFEFEEGRLCAVMTDHGRERVDHPVWADMHPEQVLSLVPPQELSQALLHAVKCLAYASSVRCYVAGTLYSPSQIIENCSDTGEGWWRIWEAGQWPGGRHLKGLCVVESVIQRRHPWTVMTDDGILAQIVSATQGVMIPGQGEGWVQRTQDSVPLPTSEGLPHRSRLMRAYDQWGLVACGSAALHRASTMEEDAWLYDALRQQLYDDGHALNQRSIHRIIFERPVKIPVDGICDTFIGA